MVEDGGGIVTNLHHPPLSSTNLHRLQKPPHELRPIARDQLDLVAVLHAHALRVGQACAGRRKGEPILEQPGEQHQQCVREPEAHDDAEREHAKKLT